MKLKEKLRVLYQKLDAKFLDQFGFNIANVTFDKVVDYMYAPKDASSLAVTRILFGLAMLIDIPGERGGATMAKRWGDPKTCHFPLFPVLQAVPMPYMALVYVGLWLGALGIMLGYKFSIAAPMFTACYWYLFLIEKTLWNNHSYLFGLVALLLSCTEAGCYWSLDTYLNPSKKKQSVPYWNYFVLKYQFFILYFMAGMKKSVPEWLTGYSLPRLSEHWVFDPFKLFLTVPQTDFLIVHLFIFVFDLTVALWMMWSCTRHVAMIFCALFHLMNSRLFSIGMFPWVCLATMPLFYPFDWPKRVLNYLKIYCTKMYDYVHGKLIEFKKYHICECRSKTKDEGCSNLVKCGCDNLTEYSNERNDVSHKLVEAINNKIINDNKEIVNPEKDEPVKKDKGEYDGDAEKIKEDNQVTFRNNTGSKQDTEQKSCRRKITVYLIACYVFIQAFLPFSHFITKGYNNWTDGIYGYSWDMMVHTWDSSATVVVKVVDNDRNVAMFIEPTLHTLNDRWSRHGDMVYQYAHCLKKNLELQAREANCDNSLRFLSKNISIYVDVWQGMNGRFVQRMFDPKIDILKATWSPFTRVPYLMPLLDEAEHWRKDMAEIREEVHSWSNYSDVTFFADFPGYEHEKFIPLTIKNVSLIILEGTVVYEPETFGNRIGRSYKITTNNRIKVTTGTMHKITNIGEKPAFYMYTFYTEPENSNDTGNKDLSKRKMSVLQEFIQIFYRTYVFGNSVLSYLYEVFKFSPCN